MTNKAIARPLKETAALIELAGGNPFRARAFANAARTIERLEEAVSDLLASGHLTDIRGIGSGLASQIEEILSYGSFEVRDGLLGALPPDLLDILLVKGLGAKKARVLWQTLGIQSLDDLEAAAVAGRIAALDGFAEKSQASILENISQLRSYQGKRRHADAMGLAERFYGILSENGAVDAVTYTGEIARNLEIVETISFVVTTNEPGSVDIPGVTLEREVRGPYTELTATLDDGMKLEIVCTEPGRAGNAILRYTGPEAFTTEWDKVYGESQQAADEASLFSAAGLPFLAPELRDLPDAFSRAGELASIELIDNSQLRGIVHNHSTYSDGAHTLKQMSDACRDRGFEYFGICDHSQSLKIAHGMSIETAARQKAEVAELNAGFADDGGNPFRVFFGVESDILADGSLDYPDEVLAKFDFIVASVHVRFNMTQAEATERVIKAVSNPYTTILGHPTGRLILKREGYPLDHVAVLEACAHYGVAIELNANPYRLDLDWRWIEKARSLNVLVSINPDAHSIEQLDLMKWGVSVARKGGLSSFECLNAMSCNEFDTFLKNKRAGVN